MPHTPSAEPVAGEHWKQMTRKGNALFGDEAFEQALQCYEEARNIVLLHFDDWPQADDAVAALVVSYLNLADTQACLGRLDGAATTLCAIHNSLAEAAADPDLPAPLRTAAIRHLREAYAALVQFRQQHGEHAIRIDATLARRAASTGTLH
ncbi:hypothetical protein [Uliginosibacterium sp. H1]|uniref:hypothetical protein n=1 Tax=Uliginosibacterium sp. H1 TaxID=3114757 RepID=UPI002E19C1C4|nr:hypothetical protein [Uliginosibacterium sp. H1]